MQNNGLKRILAGILTVILCLGCFSSAFFAATQAGSVTFQEFGVVSLLRTGYYAMVVPAVTPTGMSPGAYYVSHDPAAVNPGQQFAAFRESDLNGVSFWKITRISSSECTIQNEARGDRGYLNIEANTLSYGSKQTLNYQYSAGTFLFFREIDGQRWYIRFTNSSNNESRFHAGTGEASHTFKLYGELAGEDDALDELKKEEQSNKTPIDAVPLPEGKPKFTIACLSDLHADYGLQSQYPYVRNSVIETLNRISLEEDADVILVGGDNTSDNAGVNNSGGWTYETYENVIEAYKDLFKDATSSGRSLWAAGNHDFQAGQFEGYDSYTGMVDIMYDSCGEPISVYRQKDDSSLTDQRYPDYVMGLHYNIEGFDFLIINAPYSKGLTFSSGTLNWLKTRLKSIGKDKTVFILAHYPMTDGRGISTPSYGISGSVYSSLMSILKGYPNAIYLYGHNHGGADSVFISEDTFERINSYTASGSVVHDRNAVPKSFISSFMGSMSYYSNSYNSSALTAYDPKIVQALMIYVYDDRIVFQMKNYGEVMSDVLPASWTVMRDMTGSSSGGPTEEGDVPAIMKELLVTLDVNPSVKYDSSLSIGTYAFLSSEATSQPGIISSFGTTLEGYGIAGSEKLQVKKISSGEVYNSLVDALSPVVTDFIGYQFTVKQGNTAITPEGFVKITVPMPKDDFGPQTNEVTFAVYYVDAEGVVNMTDVQLEEDEKISFLLPSLTPFAISARANAVDLSEDDGGEKTEITGIILGCIGGGIAVIGLTVLIVLLVRLWKRERIPVVPQGDASAEGSSASGEASGSAEDQTE